MSKHKSIRNAFLIVMLIAASVITIYAYLSASTGPLTNQFSVETSKTPTVTEDSFDGITKTNVCVEVGDTKYDVYVRAAVIVTWKDNDENVYAQAPVLGTDYSMTLNTGDDYDWIKGDDGLYYYKTKVASGAKTSALITSCTQTAEAPSGYSLHVEIIAQTIQALGTTDGTDVPAVTDAWGVTLTNGVITKAP